MKRLPLTTADILKKIGIPRHKLYSLEKMGYVTPRMKPIGNVELRLFTQEDLEKIALLWKYLKEGFNHELAYEKTMKDLGRGKR